MQKHNKLLLQSLKTAKTKKEECFQSMPQMSK